MAFKIENSKVFFFKFRNHLKIGIQAFIDTHGRPCKIELNQTSSFRVLSI